ncbi:prepilin-type N-terminal cleavage/methylation domain-containing protein [Desulfoscipio sp. XC116]|uniref:type IV pilus modification PilV family protein n=1 Tax=Desulfoscipio sp. XC116 TaxID=3144975 RepID=UPI00325B726A
MDTTMKRKGLYQKGTCIKGFTLVEVLVAMAILTITVVCFTFVFGWNYENIFLMGDKSKAVAKAQESIERLYVDINDNDVGLKRIYNPNELYIYDETEPGNYYIEDNVTFALEGKEVEGYKVTVIVFYKNGERNAKISSYIMKDTSGS